MNPHRMEGQFEWAGSRILRTTVIPSKRRVIDNEDVLIPTDLREWITPAESQEIRRVVASLDMPHSKEAGDFDNRTRSVWKYVAEHITYRSDAVSQRRADFWQFPAETLALRAGDCEDCAFLLATLLLAAGISPFCVRVVFGTLTRQDGSTVGHAWPIYRAEKGSWMVLESTLDLDSFPKHWQLADDLARQDATSRYYPDICLNQQHVWAIGRRCRIQNAASYLYSKGWLRNPYPTKRTPAKKAR